MLEARRFPQFSGVFVCYTLTADAGCQHQQRAVAALSGLGMHKRQHFVFLDQPSLLPDAAVSRLLLWDTPRRVPNWS